MRIRTALAVSLLSLGLFSSAGAYERTWSIPAETGVVGIEQAQLDPAWWVARQDAPDRVILDAQAIAAQNAKLMQLDDSMFDLDAFPATRSCGQGAAPRLPCGGRRPERPRSSRPPRKRPCGRRRPAGENRYFFLLDSQE